MKVGHYYRDKPPTFVDQVERLTFDIGNGREVDFEIVPQLGGEAFRLALRYPIHEGLIILPHASNIVIVSLTKGAPR